MKTGLQTFYMEMFSWGRLRDRIQRELCNSSLCWLRDKGLGSIGV